MPIVVDASVVVPWFVPEMHSQPARQLAGVNDLLFAPDFLLLEVASSLARRGVAGDVPKGFAGRVLRVLRRRQEINFEATEPLIVQAASLAEHLPHPICDCLYLALAQREGAMLATFDGRLGRHARSLSIPLWAANDPA